MNGNMGMNNNMGHNQNMMGSMNQALHVMQPSMNNMPPLMIVDVMEDPLMSMF